jgi:hypothetical protein
VRLRAYEQFGRYARDHLAARRTRGFGGGGTRLARLRYENGLHRLPRACSMPIAPASSADDELIKAHTESATSLIAVFKALGRRLGRAAG